MTLLYDDMTASYTLPLIKLISGFVNSYFIHLVRLVFPAMLVPLLVIQTGHQWEILGEMERERAREREGNKRERGRKREHKIR